MEQARQRETTGPLSADAHGLDAAVEALRAGQLVGLPTETVYGLAGDALEADVVASIFAAKSRPADNPLIVHVAAADELARVVGEVTPLARSLARDHWPGPLTLVLNAGPTVPSITRAGLSTVAVRVPHHPVATTVLQRYDSPLAAPSANRSGRPSPTTAAAVLAEFQAEVALVLDGGPCVVGLESTVVDVRGTTPIILREGAVTREDLGVVGRATAAELTRSPGTRYRHYAPRCQIAIAAPEELATVTMSAVASGRHLGVLVHDARRRQIPASATLIGTFTDASDLARRLYTSFRDAERLGVDLLVVETVTERGVGRAVMDRLRRAAGGE